MVAAWLLSSTAGQCGIAGDLKESSRRRHSHRIDANEPCCDADNGDQRIGKIRNPEASPILKRDSCHAASKEHRQKYSCRFEGCEPNHE
ncbi:hypothetical protein, partial [Ensifer sp. LC163]|uniref:hypothetical protein n=1 Tax=Ensifer sp. LC163 TaxID=1120652 RepID=UPI001AD8049D